MLKAWLTSVSLAWSQGCLLGVSVAVLQIGYWLCYKTHQMPLVHGYKEKKDPKNSTNPVRMAKLMFCVTAVSTIIIKGECKGSVCAFSCTVCARMEAGGQWWCPPLSLLTVLRQARSLTQDLEKSARLTGQQVLQCWKHGTHAHNIQLLPWVLGSNSHPHALTAGASQPEPHFRPCSVSRAFLLFHFPLISN